VEAREYLVARLPPEGQRLIMGYGEQLIEQGRHEGREEGRQEGLLLGEARVLLKLMRLKFGAVPDEVVARVEAASEAEIEQWAERILTAETLEAVLG
jgi:predicted transposase YdaD